MDISLIESVDAVTTVLDQLDKKQRNTFLQKNFEADDESDASDDN